MFYVHLESSNTLFNTLFTTFFNYYKRSLLKNVLKDVLEDNNISGLFSYRAEHIYIICDILKDIAHTVCNIVV